MTTFPDHPGDDPLRPASAASTPPASVQVTERQRELVAALQGRGRSADLYQGALRVLADTLNPARVQLAGGALRGMIEQFERDAGFVWTGAPLGEQIEGLEAQWRVAAQAFALGDAGGAAFANDLDSFFEGYRRDRTRARERAEAVIEGLDVARRRDAPPAIRARRIDELMRIRSFASKLLHTNNWPTANAFARELERFELLLLELLRPRAVDDLERLRELIDEGPPDA
jgi:hypothetical protein